MTGINDFKVPQYMDITHPNKGFFGYLLRCKCLTPEEVNLNFIFLDDGTDCCVRFPSARNQREEIRKEWNNRIDRYCNIFQGQLYYVNEELIDDFIDFMACGSDDAIRLFLERFMAGVRASVIHNPLGIEPLYAVCHVCQLADDDRIQWPHIHILWGIKKK